jgi:dihydropteroate synthase
VAEKAIEHGAEIINDPSSLTFDPELARVVARYDPGLVLNHMRGTPETWSKLGGLKDVMGVIRSDLDATVHRATRAGVNRARIVVDPGIGFGKRKEENSEILARLPELSLLDLPLLAGPSRKLFLAHSDERLTAFATAAAVSACVHIVRVHDVQAMAAAAQVADAILAGIPSIALAFRAIMGAALRHHDAPDRASAARAGAALLPVDLMQHLKAALAPLGIDVIRHRGSPVRNPLR